MIKLKNLYNYLLENNFKKEAFFLEKKFILKNNGYKQIPLDFGDSDSSLDEYEQIPLDFGDSDSSLDEYEQIPLDFGDSDSSDFSEYLSHKSHLSARSRLRGGVIIPSAPCKYLLDNNLIEKSDKILDYGCGRGGDVEILRDKGFESVDCYDTTPKKYSDGTDIDIINVKDKFSYYDIIMCNYVFNVISEDIRASVFNNINLLLKPGGIAYISVRKDIAEDSLVKNKEYYQYDVYLENEKNIGDKVERIVGSKEEGIPNPNGFRLYKYKKK